VWAKGRESKLLMQVQDLLSEPQFQALLCRLLLRILLTYPRFCCCGGGRRFFLRILLTHPRFFCYCGRCGLLLIPAPCGRLGAVLRFRVEIHTVVVPSAQLVGVDTATTL
jgi:hypothetical protein